MLNNPVPGGRITFSNYDESLPRLREMVREALGRTLEPEDQKAIQQILPTRSCMSSPVKLEIRELSDFGNM